MKAAKRADLITRKKLCMVMGTNNIVIILQHIQILNHVYLKLLSCYVSIIPQYENVKMEDELFEIVKGNK